MQRLMAIEETGDGVLVTTTDVHLARNIADARQLQQRSGLPLQQQVHSCRANWKR